MGHGFCSQVSPPGVGGDEGSEREGDSEGPQVVGGPGLPSPLWTRAGPACSFVLEPWQTWALDLQGPLDGGTSPRAKTGKTNPLGMERAHAAGQPGHSSLPPAAQPRPLTGGGRNHAQALASSAGHQATGAIRGKGTWPCSRSSYGESSE